MKGGVNMAQKTVKVATVQTGRGFDLVVILDRVAYTPFHLYCNYIATKTQ